MILVISKVSMFMLIDDHPERERERRHWGQHMASRLAWTHVIIQDCLIGAKCEVVKLIIKMTDRTLIN